MRERQNTRYWSNKKKILGSKYLLLKHDISAQNEGKHILATSIFQNFLGELAPRPPYWGDAYGLTSNGLTSNGLTSNGCAIADLTLCQQINLRALHYLQYTAQLSIISHMRVIFVSILPKKKQQCPIYTGHCSSFIYSQQISY